MILIYFSRLQRFAMTSYRFLGIINVSSSSLLYHQDLSIRLWNIKTNILVAIFSGVEGHRDEVLSLDVNFSSTMLVSSSIDHSLKVWKLNDPSIENAVKLSYTYDTAKTKRYGCLMFCFASLSLCCYALIHCLDCIKYCLHVEKN